MEHWTLTLFFNCTPSYHLEYNLAFLMKNIKWGITLITRGLSNKQEDKNKLQATVIDIWAGFC